MASLASLANLGSVNMISFGNFDGSVCLFRRVTSHRNDSSFSRFWSGTSWRSVGVCRYSVTTNYIAEQGTSLSLDSTNTGSKDNDADAFLKAAPKPVLRAGPTISRDESKRSSNSDNGKISNKEKEKNNVIESLGEVLDKAEKLENSKKVNVPVNRPSTNELADQKNGRPFNTMENSNRKAKNTKSVWRKGSPVSTVQNIVKEPLRQEPKIDGGGVSGSQPVTPLRPPQSPQKVQPKLQAKPSAAPPPSIKKPVILKDVNAAAKSDGTDSAPKTKERKTILIDKFASKKPVVDPLIAQAVLAPPKPGKGPLPGKFKDEFRKKGGQPRRRMVDDDDIRDEDTSELGVSIPGAGRKGRKWSKASRKAARLQAERDAAPVKVEIMEVGEDGMLTEELAYNLAVSEGEILGSLYSKGIKPDGVQKLSKEMVKMVCSEYEVEVIDAATVRVEEMAKKKEIFDDDDLDKLEDRPPVLTIMGHVDHGKTTLLDYIRKTKVAASEAGGITQGIGAYKVQVPIDGKPQTCVFLDTPGHEAFGAMRARGARVTDIAVIVVAADDGIRPQTSEAIAHARAAGVPIIIAINKIDKDGANPDRVIQELSSIGLMPEDWGGDTPMVKISALKGENVDDLLETIILVAELQELKANPHRNAKGTVIEAGLDKSRGPVATFIVQNGTLRRGDVVVCGEAFGKVRALFDDKGKRVDEAGPSIPVQVIGLNNVPLAGDEFDVVSSLDIAREKAESRAEDMRNERITEKAGDGKITLSSFASAVSSGKNAGLDLHQLNVILKVDLQGSIEAVRQALQVLPQDNITLKFLLQATGDVNTSDVDLAVASKAIIFGFNVKTPGSVKTYADNKGVEIRMYKVIYELIDDVRNAMEGLLDPVEEQVPIGLAEVRAVFSSGSGKVAGCMVTEGKIVKDCGIRVLRKGKEVNIGVLGSLKRVKEMVKEVNAGLECGIGIEEFDEWEEGDIIEAFNTVQKKRTLEEASASMSAALEKAGIQR
ncbi:hypothetical protein BUALT_Bualt18G0038400 [Buddleja alternifolia]|uniref:Translation initiation factor IF-2, chloroplastic n=1 Tax=Buddleja alternifolia TaxID=168488 RepID=A0AAV6W7Z7_9LAMI|nr:hypothetical protein BUALT_Bualt18G0038400 [Buddleja alternifolia]